MSHSQHLPAHVLQFFQTVSAVWKKKKKKKKLTLFVIANTIGYILYLFRTVLANSVNKILTPIRVKDIVNTSKMSCENVLQKI